MSALGGYGLAVSRSSTHPREAITLIRFLIAKEPQEKVDSRQADVAAGPQYGLPQILQSYTPSPQLTQQNSRLVVRPSSVTGHAYEDVSQAYMQAVHSVLTGEASAPVVAAALEKKLVAITGFETGPPKTWK